MSEHVACYVRIPHPQEKVDRMEAANPDVVEGIVTPALKYIKRHLRAAGDGEVIELDEYASREDFDAFMREAAPAIERYGELLGAPAEYKAYSVLDEMSFEGDRWFTGSPLS